MTHAIGSNAGSNGYRLRLEQPFLSIRQMEPISLPQLVVIFGVNGSGKTHLLRAIYGRNCIASDQNNAILSSSYESEFIDANPLRVENPSQNDYGPQFSQLQEEMDKAPASIEFIRTLLSEEQILALKNSPSKHSALERALNRARIENKLPEISRLSDNILDQISSKGDFYTTICAFCRDYNISIFDIDSSDFGYTRPICINSGFFRPSIGDLFTRYWRKKQQFRERNARADLFERTKLLEADFERINGPEPWRLYNDQLELLGSSFRFSVPLGTPGEDWRPSLLKGEDEVAFSSLSSGEQVILNLLLASLSKDTAGLQVERSDLILLDEPDAHLHPMLVRQMFSRVIYPILDAGARIILTTHSPTTIAQVDESAIFEKIENGGLRKTTKQHAVDKLLVEVNHLAIDPTGRRQVFVESRNDQFFYENLFDIVRPIVAHQRSLSFIAAGDDKSGGKDKVKSIVQLLRSAGNRSIFGLIDWDGVETEDDFVKVSGIGAFKEIENISLNTLAIGALCIRRKVIRICSGLAISDLMENDKFQRISESVEKVFLGALDEDRQTLQLVGGSVSVSAGLAKMDGHAYSNMLLAKIPELNELSDMRKEDTRLLAIAKHVYSDLPSMVPRPFIDVFSRLLA